MISFTRNTGKVGLTPAWILKKGRRFYVKVIELVILIVVLVEWPPFFWVQPRLLCVQIEIAHKRRFAHKGKFRPTVSNSTSSHTSIFDLLFPLLCSKNLVDFYRVHKQKVLTLNMHHQFSILLLFSCTVWKFTGCFATHT